MAEKALTLIDSLELRQSMGRRALQKVRERHDIEISASKLLTVIQRFL